MLLSVLNAKIDEKNRGEVIDFTSEKFTIWNLLYINRNEYLSKLQKTKISLLLKVNRLNLLLMIL